MIIKNFINRINPTLILYNLVDNELLGENMIKRLGVLCSILLLSLVAEAADLSISADEVYKLKTEEQTEILFLDVRDPVEIVFIGFTDVVDMNIPFFLVDRNEWDDEKGVFKLNLNPNFVAEVEAALEERNLSKETMIVTMCRSGGERGLPSAQYLIDAGFENVRYVENGFQGSAHKEGEQKGMRTKNGWQNSGLPWQSLANPEKIYRVDN